MKKSFVILFLMFINFTIFSNEYGNVYILRPGKIRGLAVKYSVELGKDKVAILKNNSYTNFRVPSGENIIYCYYGALNQYVERNGVLLNIEGGIDYYIEIFSKGNNRPLNMTVLDKESAENMIEEHNMKYIKSDSEGLK